MPAQYNGNRTWLNTLLPPSVLEVTGYTDWGLVPEPKLVTGGTRFSWPLMLLGFAALYIVLKKGK